MSGADSLAADLDPRPLALRHRLGLAVLAGLGAVPLVLPAALGSRGLLTVRTLTGALFLGMFAMSWDVVSGYTGQISFGHSLFFAVGGYTSALLNLGHGVPPAAAMLAGTALAALVGLALGGPALRLEGPYLSLVTLVAPLILLQVFVFRSDVFGGELGLSNPAPLVPTAGGFRAETVASYYVAFALFVGILAVLLAVTRSDAGAVFTAIREDEDAVAASGLNPAKFKVFAFVLSAAVGGLAGAAFVHTVGQPSPSQLLVLTVSIEVIIAAVVGGMGTITGAAVGGVFLALFRDWVTGVEATVPVVGLEVGQLDLVLFSVVTLALLYYLPGGLLRWGVAYGRGLTGGDPAPATDGGVPDDRPLAAVRERWERELRRLRGGRDE